MRSTRRKHALVATLVAILFPILNVAATDAWSTGNFQSFSGKSLLQSTDPVQAALKRYFSNVELQVHLKSFASRCSHVAKLKSIGKSKKGFNLWVLEMSNKAGRAEAEPNVKIVGNLHGDEPSGRALTLGLAEWLCKNYGNDDVATRIVDDAHLWLVPTMNPDGFTAKTRENAGGKDLNRNYPDRFKDPACNPTGGEEPETAAMMKWSLATHFVASIGLHEGALVANFPWDGTPDKSTREELCPDDATFRFLAKTYAKAHPSMALPSNSEFPGTGVTNGAAWYPIYGSMQDWNYVRAGCMELTVEANKSKWPPEDQLPQLFKEHLKPMLLYIQKVAFSGVRGKIMVESNLRQDKGKEMQPVEANITIEGSNFVVKSSKAFGDYYRPLAPGKYTVVVRREGFPTARANVTVPEDGNGVERDFVLRLKRGSKAAAGSGATLTPAEQRRHNIVLLSTGVFVLWALWISHRRLVYRNAAWRRSR